MLRRIAHSIGGSDIEGHRLLAQDVDAGLQRVHGRLRMGHRRGADAHRLHRAGREQRLIIGIDGRAGLLGQGLGGGGGEVRYRDHRGSGGPVPPHMRLRDIPRTR